MTIRFRLLAAFLFLAIAPVLVLGVILAWERYQHELHMSWRQQNETAQRVSTELRSYIVDLERELEIVHRRIGNDPQNLAPIPNPLWEPLFESRVFSELSVVDATGKDLFWASRQRSVRADERHTDQNDVSFCADHPGTQPTWSPVSYDTDILEPMISVSLTLRNLQTNACQGGLIGTASFKPAWILFERMPLEPGESVYLISERGWIIAHPNASVVLRHTHFSPSHEATVQPGLDGTPSVIASAPLQVGEQTLRVIAERSATAVRAPALRGLFISGAFVLGSVLFSLVFVSLLSRKFIAPIESVARASRALCEGDFSIRLSVDNDDEIGQMSKAFNVMSEKVGNLLTSLKLSETRFRAVFDGALDGILIAEVGSGRFKMANPAMYHMLGYTESELLALSVENIHPAEDLAAVQKIFARQANKELVIAENIPVLRKDGGTFFADINSTPITFEGKACLMGVFRDATQRREAETIQLQNQRMDTLGSLAGGVAHDINNMLMPIIDLLPMVMKNIPHDSRDRTRLNMALKAAERMKDMAARILAFSREEGTHIEEIDLCTTLGDALEILRATLPSTIEIVEDLNPDTGTVLADPKQIEGVLMNLASNAADALEGKPGTLTVKLDQCYVSAELARKIPNLKPRRHAHLSVSDTGCGMDEETVAHIFDPLFTTKGTGRGTGLGLAMVFGTVMKSNGAIDVSSTLGEGTTFDIYLPIASSGENAAAVNGC